MQNRYAQSKAQKKLKFARNFGMALVVFGCIFVLVALFIKDSQLKAKGDGSDEFPKAPAKWDWSTIEPVQYSLNIPTSKVWNEVWNSIDIGKKLDTKSTIRVKSSSFSYCKPTAFANIPTRMRNFKLSSSKDLKTQMNQVKTKLKSRNSQQNTESKEKENAFSRNSLATKEIKPDHHSSEGIKEIEPSKAFLIKNSLAQVVHSSSINNSPSSISNNSQPLLNNSSQKRPATSIQQSFTKENPFSQSDILAQPKIRFSIISPTFKDFYALSLEENLQEEALEDVNSLRQPSKKFTQDSIKAGSFLFQAKKNQKNLNSSLFLSAKGESKNFQFSLNSQGRTEEEEQFYDCLDEKPDSQLPVKAK
jgi:hypothetical protein